VSFKKSEEHNRIFLLGSIVGTHGLKGELKLRGEYAEFVFSEGQELFIDGHAYTVEAARPHKNNILLKLKEIDDLTTAEKLRGRQVEINQRPDSDMVFHEDILQKEVIDQNNKRIGIVTDILYTPAHDVLVITVPLGSAPLRGREIRGTSNEILIPYIDKFVQEISDTIKVDLRELGE